MFFGDLKNIDVNFTKYYKDGYQQDCVWFTYFLRSVDDGSGNTIYEYVTFPSLAESYLECVFFSVPFLYIPGIKYAELPL